jgi:hypothetical protein
MFGGCDSTSEMKKTEKGKMYFNYLLKKRNTWSLATSDTPFIIIFSLLRF